MRTWPGPAERPATETVAGAYRFRMTDAAPPPSPEEGDLLRAARRGDAAAFAALYQRHAKAVHSLALRLCGNVETAEDITQDTFLKMLRFLPGLRAELPLRPWLKRTASNAVIDHLRRNWRAMPLPDDDILASAGTPAESTAEILGLLRRLSPPARTVIWLHLMEGWSHKDLAQRFGHSESWSKSVLSRALSQLRADLSNSEMQEDE